MRRVCFIFVIVMLITDLSAQSTAFKYQGSLSDGSNPANGNFQMQFKLFDALAAGNQIGSTLADVPVTATNGVFSVSLDFGSSALNGANRWIEIAVRRNAGESYVTLSPREQITSSPYAVRTLSAQTADTALDSQKLGGVNANQFVQTNDARLSDARNPVAGSSNYIQNQNAGPQASSNFNISGDGIADTFSGRIVNATQQYSIGGITAFRSPDASNLFVGQGTGPVNTGSDNSFFGGNAGFSNLAGLENSFFGKGSGTANTAGSFNSFFGKNSGAATTAGQSNSFFGRNAGYHNTLGAFNSFFGADSGSESSIADGVTLIGALSNIGVNGIQNATAIGYKALANTSNTLILGSVNGINGATSDTKVGIGTSSPNSGLELRGTNIGAQQRITDNGSFNSLVFQSGAGSNLKITGYNYGNGTAQPLYISVDGANTYLNTFGGSVGIGTSTPQAKLHINNGGIRVNGGNIFIAQPNSLVITSGNGACWFLTVNNSGALGTISVTCP